MTRSVLLAFCLGCAGLPALQAAEAIYPPNLKATAGAPPATGAPVQVDLVCNAAGEWFTDANSGPGSWTKTTSKLKCKAKGTWTDSFSYTWALTKHHKTLGGTVTYHGLPGCAADVWPVSGTLQSKTQFTVTATNPIANDTTCSPIFGYNLTIQ